VFLLVKVITRRFCLTGNNPRKRGHDKRQTDMTAGSWKKAKADQTKKGQTMTITVRQKKIARLQSKLDELNGQETFDRIVTKLDALREAVNELKDIEPGAVIIAEWLDTQEARDQYFEWACNHGI
jgi:hypothetical protein